MNILKSLRDVDHTRLTRDFFTLKLARFFDDLIAHGNRFFTSEIIGRHLVLTPRTTSLDCLHAIQTLHPLIPPGIAKSLLLLREPRKFHITHRHSILAFAFLDLVLVVQSLRSAIAHRDTLVNYLCFHAGEFLRARFDVSSRRPKSNLHISNMDSSIFHTASSGQNRRTTKIWLSNQELINVSPLLSFIEISSDVDNSKLSAFLQNLNYLSARTLALLCSTSKKWIFTEERAKI